MVHLFLLSKGNNFCDFPAASVDKRVFPKRALLLKNLLPWERILLELTPIRKMKMAELFLPRMYQLTSKSSEHCQPLPLNGIS